MDIIQLLILRFTIGIFPLDIFDKYEAFRENALRTKVNAYNYFYFRGQCLSISGIVYKAIRLRFYPNPPVDFYPLIPEFAELEPLRRKIINWITEILDTAYQLKGGIDNIHQVEKTLVGVFEYSLKKVRPNIKYYLV